MSAVTLLSMIRVWPVEGQAAFRSARRRLSACFCSRLHRFVRGMLFWSGGLSCLIWEARSVIGRVCRRKRFAGAIGIARLTLCHGPTSRWGRLAWLESGSIFLGGSRASSWPSPPWYDCQCLKCQTELLWEVLLPLEQPSYSASSAWGSESGLSSVAQTQFR